MAKVLAVKADLSGLDKSAVSKLNVLAVYIGKEKGTVIESILKIGEHLAEVKEIIGGAGRDSQFGPWVLSECGFSIKTATNYISAFEAFGDNKLETVSNLSDSAMYLLASDRTPEDATKEAIKRADKGEKITPAVAKEIIAKHTTQDDEPEPEEDGPDDEPEPVLDSLKGPVPESLREVFEGVVDFRAAMTAISECKSQCEALAAIPAGGRLDSQELSRLLTQARTLLRFAMPYTECSQCRRKLDKKCTACFGHGWVHESMHKTSASNGDIAWLEKRC